MKQLQPVIWSKGTFLTPQHLQTRDRFLESSIQFRLEALNFRPWGFQELQIDQQALVAGNFGLSTRRPLSRMAFLSTYRIRIQPSAQANGRIL